LQVTRELSATFHTYEHKGQSILKKTYWYEMFCEDPENIKAQTEEHISDIVWIHKDATDIQMANTYGSIKDVLENN
jgi:hypothetical protein